MSEESKEHRSPGSPPGAPRTADDCLSASEFRRSPAGAPGGDPPIDRPGEVRQGEELPVGKLREYLDREMPQTKGAPIEVEQFGRGYSNLTYLLRVGGREMVLRRPPVGSEVATAHDMGREHRVLSGLSRVWDQVPRPYLLCADPEVIGAPFYLMERVSGVILRAEPTAAIDLSPPVARRLSEVFVDTLVHLHGLDLEAAGLADLGRPAGYVGRQVEGWTRRYRGSQTDDLPEIDRAAVWLAGRIPPESGAALVHNDFKYDNLVLDPDDPTRVRAVLDWEMATVGDPLMDLGTSLGYWVQADDPETLRRFRFGPTDLPGMLTRRELVERYAERSGRRVADVTFYYVFGLLKIAVIAQQIYYRYRQGLTADPRFGMLIHAIRTLGDEAVRVIETGRI